MPRIHFLLVILLSSACNKTDRNVYQVSNEFKEYWYSGKAEVVSYNLKQARYGEIHEGNAVLIFVTEDFSREKQVKLDNPTEAGDDKASVLKLNYTKKFNTGIYPYSIMLSVFSPVDINNYPRPLKAGMTAQEWCGHVFTQMNLKDEDYQVSQYSYFEREGDASFTVPADVFTEDEIWNRIRINYQSLPVGEIEILPGLITSRLTHKDLQVLPAEATLETIATDTLTYLLHYENGHKLKIIFGKDFPHLIFGWEETFAEVTGKELITTAAIKDTLIIDYWTKNKIEHLYLRDSLGLE